MAALLTACASNHDLSKDASGKPLPPRTGVIESVKAIEMPTPQGASGYFLGGTLGNIGGAVLGGGRGAVAASVLGGAVGATAGDAAQNSDVVAGQEIWVRLENKRDPAIIRQVIGKPGAYQVGERVRVVRTPRGQDIVERETSETTKPAETAQP
jgi:outer membrane lipoprotein SlyB